MNRNRSRHRVSVHRKALSKLAEKEPESSEDELDLQDELVEEVEAASTSEMDSESEGESDAESDSESEEAEKEEGGDDGAGPSITKAKRQKKHHRYFDLYLAKALKSVSDINNSYTRNARVQLNSILCFLASTISKKAIELAVHSKRRTISMAEIVSATEFMLSGNLLDMGNELARQALVTYYSEQIPEGRELLVSDLRDFESILLKKTRGSPKKKTSSRQAKAGLIFSAALAERFIRGSGSCNLMVSSPCPIYLAAVLEYFTAELLILACNEAVSDGRLRLVVRDFVLGVRRDDEFNAVFARNNMDFVSNTVTTHLAHNVMNNLGKPFAKSIMTLQASSDCVITARFTVERHIRAMVDRMSPGTKVSKQAITYIHYLVEQELLDTLRQATYIASHSKHSKLTAADIEMVNAIKENRTPLLL